MSLLDGIRHRWYVLRRGEQYAREIEHELRFHLDLAGLASSDDGRAAQQIELEARRTLGNVTYYREEVRQMSALVWLDAVRQDLSYAWRGLRRSPGFTLAVVLTLGLGIGVNAAMFSFLDRNFAQIPTGITSPHDVRRLYINSVNWREPGQRYSYDSFTYPHFRAIVGALPSSVIVAAFTTPDSSAVIDGDARIPLRRSIVTGDYFRLLGIRAQRGRLFVDEEVRIETPTPVAVISDAFWQRAYQADAKILGRVIRIGPRQYTVIGVAAADFSGVDVDAVDVWLPANTYGGGSDEPEPWYDTFQSSFRIVARIPHTIADVGVTTAATTALRSVHLRGFGYDSTQAAVTGPLIRALGPGNRSQELKISTRLAGVSLVVLLIACANVANLLLVRSTRRRREIALRRALGVSSGRLYGQLFTETMLLGMLGGLVGLASAFWAADALRRLLLPSVQWAGPAVDLRTVIFVVGVSLISGILAGLAPIVHARRPDLINSLKAGAREGAYQPSRLRSGLLVIQTALSIVLLVGAGLFVKSLKNVRALDLGFEVSSTLLISPSFASASPPGPQIAQSLSIVADRLRSAHGVEAVAVASAAPMQGYGFTSFFLPDRDSLPPLGNERAPSVIAVSPDYFKATGITVLAGRDFGSEDRKDGAGAIIVSRAMAQLYWPGESAVGKCAKIGKRDAPCSTVVGVVADVHRMELIEKPSLQFYQPVTQTSAFFGVRELLIKTSSNNVAALTKLATQELRREFPQMLPPRARTIAQVLERQFRPWRLGAQLFTMLGLLALIVAAIGVYSVGAYAASQRTHEMGIRLALGAEARNILALMVGEGSRVLLLGIAVGIATTLAAGRLVATLLFGVSTNDPFVLVGTVLILTAIGLVATAVPAWRAAKVDPVTALRAD